MMDYLLIEHKDRCDECKLIVWGERPVCGYNDRSVEIDSKPDWCPLRPLPPDLPKAREHDLLVEGWNECLAMMRAEVET